MGDNEAGADIRARRTALGISAKALAERANVDRGRLAVLEEGGNVRLTTIAAVQRALDELEHEMGADLPSQVEMPRGYVESEHGGVVRIRLEGVFGAEAAVVEAPADNPDALAAALDIIMRRMSKGDDTARPGEAP